MGTSVSRAAMAHARTIFAALAALALTLTFAPSALFADDSVAGPLAGPGYENDARSASPNSASNELQQVNASQVRGGSDATPTLAATLAGPTASIVSADVALDASDPVIGSFTVDGMTYALDDGKATLISVGATFVVAPYEGSADSGDGNAIAIPSSVAYDGTTYSVTAIGPYAFYLSGATSVALPGSIASVDSRAFRSSDVERVEVDAENPDIASFDGALYSADLSSLLLIPEGRAGAVLLPETAEVAQASKFSHCSLVDAISVGEGGADFASWDGLLYDASGTTLLRVPAGATDITIRDGCTSIAAGAMEGCAKLETINAPASVVSISPDVFTSIPIVSLPAVSVSGSSQQVQRITGSEDVPVAPMLASGQDAGSGSQDDSVAGPLAGPGYEGDARSASADSSAEGKDGASGPAAPQLTAMVALSTADDGIPEVDPSSIEVALPEDADAALWQAVGLSMRLAPPVGDEALTEAAAQLATLYSASHFIEFNVHSAQGWRWLFKQSFLESPSRYEVPFAPNMVDNKPSNGIAWFYDSVYGYGIKENYEPNYSMGYAFNQYATCHRIRYGSPTGTLYQNGSSPPVADAANYYLEFTTTVAFHRNGGQWADAPQDYVKLKDFKDVGVAHQLTGPDDGTIPARLGYKLVGWNTAADGSGTAYRLGQSITASSPLTLYAQWESIDITFDTGSEPKDESYPGDAKDPVSVPDAVGPDGTIEIEDPKRPGYIFEGWVIPNGDGIEAVDQNLVYQGDDGKWYVDASKLPDYAGDDGRVELTARWTSVISVDVPSSVTFYADLVTQGQQSREGAAEGAFGQNQVANQSQVDLRVVGLESSAVKTTDATLGADSVLKRADAATPSTSTQKLLSLYPSTKQWKPEDLQDPDVVGGSKAATAVDFDLDDILLEKSFKADDFTIAAGGTLNMGYRLNLTETGQQLDYDKLATLSEGQSASIANVSYCFAADALPSDWGEPLWIENPDRTSNPAKYLLLDDIKEAADDLSANGTASECYPLYKGLLDAGTGFHLKVGDAYHDVNILGICQDTRSDTGAKAGLAFGFADCYALDMQTGGGVAFDTRMNGSATTLGGWRSSDMRSRLQGAFYESLGQGMRSAATGIVPVRKASQLSLTEGAGIQEVDDTVFLPSVWEVYGVNVSGYNPAEGGTGAFQYQWFSEEGHSNPNARAAKLFNGAPCAWWTRSAAATGGSSYFCGPVSSGLISGALADTDRGVLPCFCL